MSDKLEDVLHGFMKEYLGVDLLVGEDRWEAFTHHLSNHVDAMTGIPDCLLSHRRCLVEGCTNTSDQGAFDGSVCMPCGEFLKSRKNDHFGTSQAYRNHVDFAREAFNQVASSFFVAHFDRRKP